MVASHSKFNFKGQCDIRFRFRFIHVLSAIHLFQSSSYWCDLCCVQVLLLTGERFGYNPETMMIINPKP
jgi:hypothetical protein